MLIGEVQPHHQCPHFNYNRGSQSRTDTGLITWCTILFTNRYWQDTATGSVTYLIFISDGKNLQKFCFWNIISGSGIANITDCTDIGVGNLEIVHTSVVPVLFGKSFNNGTDPKLAYENHTKDI